jgi:hypothetical protein
LGRENVCPSGFVTDTETAPAEETEGTTQDNCKVEIQVVVVQGFVPIFAVAPESKFVPLIMTVFVPPIGPTLGETLVTVGGGEKLNPPSSVSDWPLGLVTTTSTGPDTALFGVEQEMELDEALVMLQLAPPKVTVRPVPETNPLPVNVTKVPPDIGPLAGEMSEREGPAK